MKKIKQLSLLLIATAAIASATLIETENNQPSMQVSHITPNVAWGVYELTGSEAAAGVAGTGTAIATTGAVSTAIKGASWGARIGKYAGPWGALAGAVVGGL